LVGCGRAAELIYSPVINKFPDIEIKGVIDPLKERRELISAKFKNCYKNNYIDSNFIDQIDAAIISTPPDSHISAAAGLLKNNKYVLVEKPLALSMEGVNDLIEIEMASRASLMMGFNHRYWQPVINLKKKLLNLKVYSAEIIFISNYSSWNPVSFKGEPLDDLGPHVFDLVRFIFEKEILSVSAGFLKNDELGLKIKIQDGILISSKIAHSNKSTKSINVFSDIGNFNIKLGSTRISSKPGSFRKILDLKDTSLRKLSGEASPLKNTYYIQMKNFINFVKSKIPAEPDIKDGVEALIAAEAAAISINENGKEIYLDEIR
jgi:predicted dehydrogenase